MSFSEISSNLQYELRSNLPQIKLLLKTNPALAFTTINEIAANIGKTYHIKITLNFPERGKIEDFESYGTENLGMIFQRDSKAFPTPRESIKSKALEILGNALIQDAYMYEGREGVRVIYEMNRLDILPASLHLWGKVNDEIIKFCDWLLDNCYEIKLGVKGAFNDINS